MESQWGLNFVLCAFALTSIFFYSQLSLGSLVYLLEKLYSKVILLAAAICLLPVLER